jgi:hypothetical protein
MKNSSQGKTIDHHGLTLGQPGQTETVHCFTTRRACLGMSPPQFPEAPRQKGAIVHDFMGDLAARLYSKEEEDNTLIPADGRAKGFNL